jgi:hypothetical protein
LTTVVSGSFLLTTQALAATPSVALHFSTALAALSTIDCNVLDLPLVGTSVGTSGEGAESSVPVALTAIASLASLPTGGNAGSASIGVTDHGVEGCEIIVPKFSWSETWQLPIADYD